jgi:hypothetical protein
MEVVPLGKRMRTKGDDDDQDEEHEHEEEEGGGTMTLNRHQASRLVCGTEQNEIFPYPY